MEFEWAQTEPFNTLFPKLCGGKLGLAGCCTVAAAGIMMYHKKKFYDWSDGDILLISNNPLAKNVQSNNNTRSVDPDSYDYKLLKWSFNN